MPTLTSLMLSNVVFLRTLLLFFPIQPKDVERPKYKNPEHHSHQKTKPMKTLRKLIFLSVVLAALFSLPSCKSRHQGKISGKSAQMLSEYVSGYTNGVISRAQSIVVQLAHPREVEEGSKADPGLLTISPRVEGELIWQDSRTLAFVPKALMPPEKKYKATLHLGKMFGDVPKDLAVIPFVFSTKPLHGYLTVNPPVLGGSTASFQVEGTISTTDVVKDEDVEKMFQVKGNVKHEVEWTHNRNHHFVIKSLPVTKAPYDLNLTWNGQQLNMETINEKVEIPAKGTFQVLDIKHSNFSSRPSIKVYFSDVIKKRQDFQGLVSIKGYSGSYKFWPEGSVLSVIPTDALVGRYKIEVNKGILSAGGRRLKTAFAKMMEFEKMEPQIRMVGRGVIVPRSGSKVYFPFEAVALKYVNVEIFKIFNNNVLQFLQVNEPDGRRDLQRVGRIIYQKKVELSTINPNANTSIWTRYALDLSDIIDQDPSAVYQVRLAFQPGYGLLDDCDDLEVDVDPETFQFLPVEQQEEVTSIMGDYYGVNGYFDDYSWSNRDNPCAKEYYNNDRFVQKNVFLSDMGIIAKAGEHKEIFLSISDLNTTKPMGGVDVEFFDYQQQSILSGKTDQDGIFHSVLPQKAYFVKAGKGDKVGYLRMADGQNLSISRFDVDGQYVQEGTKGFLYGDRGVWRPGDSIYLNFVLVKEEGMDEQYPVTLEVRDARNNLSYTKTISHNIKGLYSFPFATRPDAPTGYWKATVSAGGAKFDKTLRIETIKPNRLKILTDLPEKLTASNANRKVNLQINWLHGAPASYVDVSVQRQFRRYKTKFPNYGDYTFDDPTRRDSYQMLDVFQGKTDADGKASFTDNIAEGKEFPGMMKVGYQIKATEKGGDFSTNNFAVVFSPYDVYSGVMIPESYGYKRFNLDEPNTVKVVTINDQGKPVSGRTLELDLFRLRWSWWWDSDDDMVSNFNNSKYATPVEHVKLISDSQGRITWEVTPPDWGRYLVRVYDPLNGQSAGEIAYAGHPWGDNQSREQLQAAAMLPLEPEKKVYNVGDKVKVKVPTGKTGRALITIEKGGTIVSEFRRESNDGSNVFTFTATEDMVPNIYVSVSMVQPHANTSNDLPMRMYGIVPIKIENPKAKLEPKIATAPKWQPDSDVQIKVSEAKGRSMAYTIAIVDDGLLDLTHFRTPSPYDALNAKEALSVKTWDVYDYILGAFNGDNERILAIGGDDEKVDNEKANSANRFKPVVLHLGPFELKKGRTATHTFHFPNYVGSVRAMVVAVGDEAYGNADVTVPVRKPLMVQPTLPRVLGSGEQVVLPVTVFAMEPDVKDVEVSLSETSGLVTFPEGKTKRIHFDKLGDQVVYFPVNVKDIQGIAHFKIKSVSGRHLAQDEIEISVRNANPMMSDVEEIVLKAGASETRSVAPFGVAGSNETTIEVASVPPLNLGNRLNYLIRYPHGCIEQTTSSVFPQLYVGGLMDLDDTRKEQVDKNIKAGIDRLRLFQVSEGGFSYWPGGGDANPWGSNYAGHFLLEAKAKGYVVSETMLDKWVRFQTEMANDWRPNSRYYGYSYFDQAYRLHTLALAGKPAKGAMNRLRNDPKLSNMARWQLAAAYALIGKKDIGKQLLAEANTDIKPYRELGYSYGSPLRDKGMALETMLLLGQSTASFKMLKEVSQALGSSRWYSTHATAYGLLGIGKYYAQHKPDQLAFSYTINGKPGSIKSDKPIVEIKLTNPDQAQKVSVKNTSNGDLYLRIIRQGKPKAGEEQPVADSDLQMRIAYKNLQGEKIDPTRLPRGEDFYAEVTIANPGTRLATYKNMALTQIFPSGWEIGNARMSEVQALSASDDFDYQDIRDDRVFTYFDLNNQSSKTYRVLLNAAYPGKYYLPATYCEAMYDNTIRAASTGHWVAVVDK